MNDFNLYFVNQGVLCIAGLSGCGESHRTVDIRPFDLANNVELLNLLGLYYIQGNFGASYTYESRAKWFCGYLSSFGEDRDNEKYNNLMTNSHIRLLIEDDCLRDKVFNVLQHTK